MEVARVLHMNGGTGETSYANNSHLQGKVISATKPIMEEAIISVYEGILIAGKTRLVSIADLGCSSGPNTLAVVSEVISLLLDMYSQEGRDPREEESPLPIEYQVFLNDLPGNDFNTLFTSCLPAFYHHIGSSAASTCFVNAVPGSFYAPLFPANSLHFVHSSYSLQWLSQVPKGLEGSNKRNIYMARTSPASVVQAYYKQFQDDFSTFLRCRSKELVLGGRMVLTFLGRKSKDSTSKECCYIWELLALALNDMVSEGLIREEDVDSFNIPQYTPCAEEIQLEVSKQGSFAINRMEVSAVSWKYCTTGAPAVEFNEEASSSVVVNRATSGGEEGEYDGGDQEADAGGAQNVAKCMRAVAQPLLAHHFGEGIIDELFNRYRAIIADRMSKERTEFINVVVSMTKFQQT